MHVNSANHRNLTWYVPLLGCLGLAIAMPPVSLDLGGMDLVRLENLLYWAFFALSVITSILAGLNKDRAYKPASVATLALGFGLLGVISLRIGRPPLSGAYESICLMAAVLSFLSWRAGRCRISNDLALPAWGFGAAALILSLLTWVPRQVNPDWFVYQFGWSRAFFLCRGMAMAFLLFSALATLAWPRGDIKADHRRELTARSRRMLLLGTALFLVGEVCGFYWCLTWRGDYWLWNRNFMESTMIFILASAALHLPPALAAKTKVLRIAYSVPGLLATGAYLVHQVTEAFLS